MGLIMTSARILPRFTMPSRSSVWTPNGAARTRLVGLDLSSPDGRAVWTEKSPLALAMVDTKSPARHKVAIQLAGCIAPAYSPVNDFTAMALTETHFIS